jgi:hypothetical protein
MFAGIFGPSEAVLVADPTTIGLLVLTATFGHVLGHFVVRALQMMAEKSQGQKN